MTGSESNHNSNRSVVNRIRMAATPAEAERLLRIFMDKKLTTKQHASSDSDEERRKLKAIICTLWSKNFSEMLSTERVPINQLADKIWQFIHERDEQRDMN